MDADVTTLSKSLLYELVGSVGLPRDSLHWLFRPIFRPVTDRLAQIGVAFNRLVREAGFPKAAAWALTNWCTQVTARGTETIPAKGPLLVVSNHPGTYDSIVVASQMGRKDICYVSGDIPFLKYMPDARQHFFFVSRHDPHDRMVAARRAIRHLQQGGSLLLFGAGHLDPDPAVYPDAAQHIDRWSASLEIFLRHVPGVQVLIAIVSGVVSPRWARSPITWLRRDGLDRRRLAEFGQVITQLLFPGRLMFSPRVTFAPPVTAATLRHESGSEQVLPAIIARAQTLLTEHCRSFGGTATV
jgi:hypothetical protein